jgi:hypothetical protein
VQHAGRAVDYLRSNPPGRIQLFHGGLTAFAADPVD